MSGLSDIRVTIEPRGDAASGNALPILYEIVTRLEALIEHGATHSIDLKGLPLAPGDYERLRDILGKGEVDATVDALGLTRVRETAIQGVWWITHMNAHEQVMAELIEVTRCPEILRTQPDDVRDAVAVLRERLGGGK
jgi:hydrogenase-1 operon protein HyaF